MDIENSVRRAVGLSHKHRWELVHTEVKNIDKDNWYADYCYTYRCVVCGEEYREVHRAFV